MQLFKRFLLVVSCVIGVNAHGMAYLKSWHRPAAASIAALYGSFLATRDVKNDFSPQILGARPIAVQTSVNEAFENIRELGAGWKYDGRYDSYYLLGINDHILLKNIALKNSEKKDVYVIDVGCSRGEWGHGALKTFQSDDCKKSGKRFHIISVTGGKECDESIDHHGHVTHYQFNQFKIENIQEELLKRGLKLENKVDLIVSQWTLRHLVDPFGTLKQMYRLLTPTGGKLLSNGFLFKLSNSDEVQGFPLKNEDLLINTSAAVLFRKYDSGRDAGQFLLEKNSTNDLGIPLNYTGQVFDIGDRYQCESELTTVFDSTRSDIAKLKRDFERDYVYVDNKNYWPLYCGRQDQKCADLYRRLKDQKMFEEELK